MRNFVLAPISTPKFVLQGRHQILLCSFAFPVFLVLSSLDFRLSSVRACFAVRSEAFHRSASSCFPPSTTTPLFLMRAKKKHRHHHAAPVVICSSSASDSSISCSSSHPPPLHIPCPLLLRTHLGLQLLCCFPSRRLLRLSLRLTDHLVCFSHQEVCERIGRE